MSRRFFILALLVGLTMILIAGALPHSHHGVPDSSARGCVLCHAQSVQPLVEPPMKLAPSLSVIENITVYLTSQFFPNDSTFLPDSRAPPLAA